MQRSLKDAWCKKMKQLVRNTVDGYPWKDASNLTGPNVNGDDLPIKYPNWPNLDRHSKKKNQLNRGSYKPLQDPFLDKDRNNSETATTCRQNWPNWPNGIYC